jgi:hypothetical protein
MNSSLVARRKTLANQGKLVYKITSMLHLLEGCDMQLKKHRLLDCDDVDALRNFVSGPSHCCPRTVVLMGHLGSFIPVPCSCSIDQKKKKSNVKLNMKSTVFEFETFRHVGYLASVDKPKLYALAARTKEQEFSHFVRVHLHGRPVVEIKCGRVQEHAWALFFKYFLCCVACLIVIDIHVLQIHFTGTEFSFSRRSLNFTISQIRQMIVVHFVAMEPFL